MLEEKTSASIRKTIETDEQVVTVIEKFDTSKSNDPNTGRPPLQERTTQIHGKVEKKVKIAAAEQGSEASLSKETFDQFKRETCHNIENETIIEHQEKRGQNVIACMLSILGALTVLVSVWKLLKHFRIIRL